MNSKQPKKQRNRKPISCWPCRERKVRCDRISPCATCKRRGHVHLCRVEGPGQLPGDEWQATQGLLTQRQSAGVAESQSSVSATSSVSAAASNVQRNAASTCESNNNPLLIPLLDKISQRLEPTHKTDNTTRERVYLGQNCAANFFRALMDLEPERPLLPSGVSIESAFCLTNRTSLHPFGSLWSYAGDVSLINILHSLPAVEVCLSYYRNFQQNVLPFYPFLLNWEIFESRFCDFLQALGDEGIAKALELAAAETVFQDAAWYGVMFGVLACGCQFNNSENASDGLLKARVFVAAAFECLRLANVFGMPSEATIQALLMIELAIANDANPGMAWSLIGTTAQNAQSIGLHINMNRSIEWDATIHPLWSAIWFLDSSLSLAFGRRPSSFVAGRDQHDLHIVRGMTFPTFCSWTGAIHKLKLSWQLEQQVDVRASGIPAFIISTYLQSLANLEIIPPYGPRSKTKPNTIHRRIEQLVSLIHISHFQAEILRIGALSQAIEAACRSVYFDEMMKSLDTLIAAYCTLKPLSATMANSWPILYATISAALLLSGMSCKLAKHSPPVVQRLIRVLGRAGAVEDGDDHSHAIGRNAYADGLIVLRHLQSPD